MNTLLRVKQLLISGTLAATVLGVGVGGAAAAVRDDQKSADVKISVQKSADQSGVLSYSLDLRNDGKGPASGSLIELPFDASALQLVSTEFSKADAWVSKVDGSEIEISIGKIGSGGDTLQPKIRFGLGGVKGVGESALEAIFEARSGMLPGEEKPKAPKNQPFVDVFDLCARVDLRRVNKGVLEALVQCGAFDECHTRVSVTRASAFSVIDGALERGKKIHSERVSGQTNLFGLLGTEDAPASILPPYVFAKVEPWDTREMLAREKSTLGFYVSGHPLDRYALELTRFANATTESIGSMSEGAPITIGGSVEGYRERPTKTGSRIAFFSLEDALGRVEVIVRPKLVETMRPALQAGDPVMLKGVVQFEQNRGNPNAPPPDEDAAAEPKIVLESVQPLAEALRQKTKSVRVTLRVERVEATHLKALREVLLRHPGPCPVALELRSASRWTASMNGDGIRVEPSESLLASLERIFGEKVAELRT